MHKGAMLKIILNKAGLYPTTNQFSPIKAIVFVDDKPKHTKRVDQVLSADGFEVTAIRYGKEDAKVLAFKESDKEDVIRSWNLFNRDYSGLSPESIDAIFSTIFN